MSVSPPPYVHAPPLLSLRRRHGSAEPGWRTCSTRPSPSPPRGVGLALVGGRLMRGRSASVAWAAAPSLGGSSASIAGSRAAQGRGRRRDVELQQQQRQLQQHERRAARLAGLAVGHLVELPPPRGAAALMHALFRACRAAGTARPASPPPPKAPRQSLDAAALGTERLLNLLRASRGLAGSAATVACCAFRRSAASVESSRSRPRRHHPRRRRSAQRAAPRSGALPREGRRRALEQRLRASAAPASRARSRRRGPGERLHVGAERRDRLLRRLQPPPVARALLQPRLLLGHPRRARGAKRAPAPPPDRQSRPARPRRQQRRLHLRRRLLVSSSPSPPPPPAS